MSVFRATHALERVGDIKNTNAVIRRDIRRKTKIADYTARDIDELACAISSTSRKRLIFKTLAKTYLENLNQCV